ncbi:fucose-binding lectin II [Paraburkholderia sediminicola]|uniref:fucose-binding lectin II n=1 Tax=Paraburkholderia sediminicola TaxID=458836 RepID=UPI0038BD8BE3
MDSSTISFKASNGLFVGRDENTNLILARTESLDAFCKFTVQVVAPGKITLLGDNGLYLSRTHEDFAFSGGDCIWAGKKSVDETCVFSYQDTPASPSVVLKADNGLYISLWSSQDVEDALAPTKKDIDSSCYFQLIGSIPGSNVRDGTFKLPPNTRFGVTGLVNSAAAQEIDVFIGDDPKPHTLTGKPGTQDGQMGTIILESDATGHVRLTVTANGKQSKLMSRQVDLNQTIYFGLLGAEDGTDNDYNDCIAILNWPLG